MLPTYSKHTLRPSSALWVQVGRPVVVHAARSAAPYGDAFSSCDGHFAGPGSLIELV